MGHRNKCVRNQNRNKNVETPQEYTFSSIDMTPHDPYRINKSGVYKGFSFFEGNLDLRNNKRIKSLGSLKRVRGNLLLQESGIVDLGDLEYVEGNVDLSNTNISSVSRLETVLGYCNLNFTRVTDISTMKDICGTLYIVGTPLGILGDIKLSKGVAVAGETYDASTFREVLQKLWSTPLDQVVLEFPRLDQTTQCIKYFIFSQLLKQG